MQILIAEDDDLSRLILQATLENLGHRCLVAADGLQAWELFEAHGADVVISDWLMPGMNGLELCQRVRGRNATLEGQTDPSAEIRNYTYFIFLTALDDPTHLVAGIDSGADDYLAKPLNTHELVVRLKVATRITSLHQRMTQQAAELARLNQALYEQARKDSLTGLHNRLQLVEDLEVIMGRRSRYGEIYNAILVDIDNFKPYNDTYGHQPGDDALRITAQTLLTNIRKEDRLYRYGGEEFLIILPHQTSETTYLVAEKLRQMVLALQIPHSGNPPTYTLTVSAGIAELPPGPGYNEDDWIKAADRALYQAKQAGRNCVRLVSIASENAS